MRKRPLHILVLLWQAVWLLMIVPGHTRGQIVLPGTYDPPTATRDDGRPGISALAGCCSVTSSTSSNDGEPEPMSEQRKANCAVCHFAARMSVAVALVFVLPPPVVVEEVPALPPVVAYVCEDVRVLDARGPPIGPLPVVI